MNDIKEYFTANKHPLIRRSARINQRLRAAACHGRASETPRSQRVALWAAAAAAAAGTADGGRLHGLSRQQRISAHTRNLINIQQRGLDWKTPHAVKFGYNSGCCCCSLGLSCMSCPQLC